MSEAEVSEEPSAELATGTYQVLRNRLRDAAGDLRDRFEALNKARSAVFGNIETKLGSTAHVATDHNCIPRDLLSFSDKILLGYNVQFGLKTDIRAQDVFSVYRMDDSIAHQLPLDNFVDDGFRRDFEELYRYYKNTTFSRFFVAEPFVYFVFQVGKSTSDIKAFKWAIEGEHLRYVDSRSDQEVRFPEQYAFRWRRASRDQHRSGLHPHISIDDVVFVECVGGDLTVKVEDNTEDGSGIYSELVDNPDQTLDDAEIYYARLGNLVLLKIRPYQEKEFRFLVFSIKLQQAWRLDGISQSCVLLPDDQGIVFPSGFVLQTGESKQFDHGLFDLSYEKTIAAPNGEDYLYLFTDLESGTYLHLRYNMIRQEVDTPLICHGQAFFDDGSMISFRSQDLPQKHHALQLWQTPFVGPNYRAAVETDSMLYKIGNRELVRGMAECQELLHLIDKDDSYAELYVELEKRATDILDGYFWIDREETMDLAEPLKAIREAAASAVEEYDKVVRVRKETQRAYQRVADDSRELIASIGRSSFHSIEEFIESLAKVREQRGHAIGLKELHYVDVASVGELEELLGETSERLGHRCVQFLLDPDSLSSYESKLVALSESIQEVRSVTEGRGIEEELGEVGDGLELLIETISQLKIEDLTQRTAIVDRTGDVLAKLNRARSSLKAKIRDLLSDEMEADFASQTRLLDQAAAGALETADSPEKVDDALTRIMLQVEELEGRFAEFDDLVLRLTEKRETLYEAFEARRQHLVEQRSRRADAMAAAADRILQGIATRANRISDADELRSYFAADPMVAKVRGIAEQLSELGDSVRQDDVLSRLKATSDDALRQLRDRRDLFSAGDGTITLGKHQFSVNRQPIELTTVVRDGSLKVHLTGTQFFQTLTHPELESAKDLWGQTLPTENKEVYRAEFLAWELFTSWDDRNRKLFTQADPEEQIELVRSFMQHRHDGGYSRGVHDQDAQQILMHLIAIDTKLGLLKFSPRVRGCGRFIWQALVPSESRQKTQAWVRDFSKVKTILPGTAASRSYVDRIARLLARFGSQLLPASLLQEGAEYLFQQIRDPQEGFVLSPTASNLLRRMEEHLPADARSQLFQATSMNAHHPKAAWILAMDAVAGYFAELPASDSAIAAKQCQEEVAAQILLQELPTYLGPDFPTSVKLESLSGDHPKIKDRVLDFQFHEFVQRLSQYRSQVVPRFEELRNRKRELLAEADRKIRTQEFKAKVLTSFVRNQLIDEVYLPLVGDNLAKQMGAAGDNKRTDRMGLLLLISPPGYGKTTLMEYIANRLGLVFVKINGPALGHSVTSLDPSEATNASAREEVERINVALEMGDNVMLYLDDIQHCHPELLQKFIPLCDATRRIEGVWEGEAKTYDLRGRKIAVVMAGNPYTESGERFQIPDMLSNRADIYNLGEIIGDSREAFELSYIENCLTSNAALQPLAQHSSRDQRRVIRAAAAGSMEALELETPIGADDLRDMVSVLAKLLQVRDIVLKVNRTYIQSAAQQDAYRTEPPFKLQGSYRNMNRIAERVVPVMNDQELLTLVYANYEQDTQTLTTDGEANLLKFKELMGILSEDEKRRWEQIQYAYVESVRMQGVEGEDTAAKVLRSLGGLRDGLESIRKTLVELADNPAAQSRHDAFFDALGKLQNGVEGLGAKLSEAIVDSARRLESSEDELPETKVLVQHSVPRVMTDLVQSQFQLLYDGLRPLLEASAGSKSQLESLQATVERCVNDYRQLLVEIESAKDK